MRDFTKSALSFSWVMSLFGLKQLGSLFTPGDPAQTVNKTSAAFDAMTKTIAEQLDDSLKDTFKTGDNLQRQMVDMMFGSFGMGMLDPRRWMKMSSDAMKGSTETMAGSAQSDGAASAKPQPGWGPVK
jgi:hypothetical protein